MTFFDVIWKPETAFKQLGEHANEVIAILEEIKTLSISLLYDYNTKNFKESENYLKKLVELDTKVVGEVKEDSNAYIKALNLLKECHQGIVNFSKLKSSDVALLTEHIESAAKELETRETALKIMDKNALAEYMNLISLPYLDKSDIERFEKSNHEFLSLKKNKRLKKLIMKQLNDKLTEGNDFLSLVYKIAGEIIKEIARKRRDPDVEHSQMKRGVELILKEYPSKSPEEVGYKLSSAVHELKRDDGRRGR